MAGSVRLVGGGGRVQVCLGHLGRGLGGHDPEPDLTQGEPARSLGAEVDLLALAHDPGHGPGVRLALDLDLLPGPPLLGPCGQPHPEGSGVAVVGDGEGETVGLVVAHVVPRCAAWLPWRTIRPGCCPASPASAVPRAALDHLLFPDSSPSGSREGDQRGEVPRHLPETKCKPQAKGIW